MDRLILALSLCILLFLSESWSESLNKEVCDGAVFEVRCDAGQVLLIKSALYGRMKLGNCVKIDMGYLGCSADVLSLFDKECSGKASCGIGVNSANHELVAHKTCVAELTSYAEVEYSCVRVVNSNGPQCRQQQETKLTSSSGVLSSHVTDETGCGGLGTPWVIRTSPGQRVSLSMTDFGWQPDEETATNARCQPYGYISEPGIGVNQTVCGGLARERQVYMSSSSHVVIQLVPTSQRELKASFLLAFHVLGCPDITPPAHAWYKRDGDAAVIGCEWSEHSWHLTCEGNTWVGVVGNCSAGGIATPETKAKSWAMSPMLSVSLIIGLGVLVVALICILAIGCICMKSSGHRTRIEKPTEFQPPDQQQAFLYYPGRAAGLPVTGQSHSTLDPTIGTGSTLQASKPTRPDELIHIWETPLPNPQEGNVATEAGVGDNFATIPCRGTMTGPPPVYKEGSTAGRSDHSSDTYWAGTDRYYDNDMGWVTMPKPPNV